MDLKKYFLTVTAGVTVTLYHIEQAKEGERSVGPNERRRQLIKVLFRRERDTMDNLAAEFGVSRRTILRDLEVLSLEYPIVTKMGRYGGGVSIAFESIRKAKRLSSDQTDLLFRLLPTLAGKDRQILQTILDDFT